jgi:lincosamide nucleotidyltransferase
MSPEAAAVEALLDRLAAACRADKRIEGAFLAGSRAAGKADEHSDVDVCVVTADGQRDAVWADREALVRQLGEPLQLEDFDGDQTVFFILADGTDGELTVTDAAHLPEVSMGPHRAILDRSGVLANVHFTGDRPDAAAQVEQLRRHLQWFWHDVAHFVAAVGRGELWWAAGQLDALRRYAVNLARLRTDFDAHLEDFDKLDKAVPAEDLAPLAQTFVPLDRRAILEAGLAIVAYYREVAPPLAEAHGLPYPAELERIMLARLEALEP